VQLPRRFDKATGLCHAHERLDALKPVHRFPRLQYSRKPNNSARIIQ
jgi:hypothetical protein